MASEVAILLDWLGEDNWWSQGGILQPDEVYKADLQRYRQERVQDDVRGGPYVAEEEERFSIRIVGALVNGLSDGVVKNVVNASLEKGEVWGGTSINIHSDNSLEVLVDK